MPDRTTGTERDLDKALADSFPASDPPAMTAPAIASVPESAAGEETKRKLVDFHRVVPRAQSHTPFDPQSNRSGGRWTSPGVPAVYASLTPAGAVLEFLAHVDGEKPIDLTLVRACIPDGCIVHGDALPPHWRDHPYRDDVRTYGDAWIASRRSLALRLPSVLCEQSQNLLINPEHDDSSRIQVTGIEAFTLDPRLLRR